jgi:hypothetical protein
MPVIIGLLVVVVVVLVIGWIQDQRENRRVARLRSAAEGLGYEFREEEDASLLSQTVPFLLFHQGVSSAARNVVLTGFTASDDEAPRVAAFEYGFDVPYGRYVQRWRQTVIQVISPSLSLPAFSVMPHPVFEALAKKTNDERLRELALSSGPLAFDDAGLFTEQSHVYGLDRARIRSLFTEALIGFFEAHPDLCVEAGDSSVILYRFEKLTSADELPTFLDTARELHQHLKEASE